MEPLPSPHSSHGSGCWAAVGSYYWCASARTCSRLDPLAFLPDLLDSYPLSTLDSIPGALLDRKLILIPPLLLSSPHLKQNLMILPEGPFPRPEWTTIISRRM